MSTIIGKISLNKLSISRKPESPIYGIEVTGNVSECFYDPNNPNIKLNDSIFIIQEVSMNTPGILPDRVVDEYELLITYVDSFVITPYNTFELKAEGKRLNHEATVKTVDPVISNIYAYRSALALHITGDIYSLFNEDNVPATPEARAYLASIDTINHLGTLYKRVADSSNNYFVYARDESDQLNIKKIRVGVILLYSNKDVPVQEDLETVKHISRRILCK